MPFVTCADVEQLQADVKSQADDLSTCIVDNVTSNVIGPTSPIPSQWASMRKRVDTFLAQDCTNVPILSHVAAQMDAGQQLQRDLQPWYDRLTEAGCKNVPTKPTPPPPPQDLFGNITTIVEIVALLFILRELR